MEVLFFRDNEEVVDKLKEMDVLTKTKTVKDLNKLKYKRIDSGNKVIEYAVKILGYAYKKCDKKCFAEKYENLIIESAGKVFNINPEFLKAMQKKNFGTEDTLE